MPRIRRTSGHRSDSGDQGNKTVDRAGRHARSSRATGRGARSIGAVLRNGGLPGSDGGSNPQARAGVSRSIGRNKGQSMGWEFTPTEEQGMLVDSVRQFMEKEIFPHEREIERRGEIPIELGKQIQKRAKEQGLHAANMPEEAGGGGLDFPSATLMDRELGKSTWGLVGWVGRPSEILNACQGDQRETYLLPTVRGERKEAFGLTEPNAGSDAMSIQTRATADGGDYVINGSKHFISCVTKPDFVILFTVTGIDQTAKGERKRITCFLVDVGTKGFDIRRGPRPVSHRAYHNYQLSFDGCRVSARNILGEEGKGFELAGQWLSNTRILTASTCCGKAERALQIGRASCRERV